MIGLTQLQRDLQAHVMHGANGIATQIKTTDALPAATRLGIYSDAYRLRLIEALESNYPVLAELLGGESFASLGGEYLEQHPSQHFSIRWFGHQLPAFLAATRSDAPWLIELAHWEWATSLAFDAADAPLLTRKDLASVSPTNWPSIQFTVQPSLQRMTLNSNVVELIKAAVASEALPVAKTAATTQWCLWRRELTVQYRSLDKEECVAVDALIAGANFGAICERLAAVTAAEDIPLKAASLLKQWIEEQWLSRL